MKAMWKIAMITGFVLFTARISAQQPIAEIKALLTKYGCSFIFVNNIVPQNAPPPGFYLKPEVPCDQYRLFEKIDSTVISYFFNDDKLSWKFNLLLYGLFKKEASLIYQYRDSPKEWLDYKKDIDLAVWLAQFAENKYTYNPKDCW